MTIEVGQIVTSYHGFKYRVLRIEPGWVVTQNLQADITEHFPREYFEQKFDPAQVEERKVKK